MTTPISIGTVEWNHRQWRNTFYPAALDDDRWLSHYAETFSHVEIAESLFKLPERPTLSSWLERTPDSFCFTLTAPRTITHYKKLKNCEIQTNQLFTRLSGMEHRLRNILFRLPARWRCNLRRLETFVARLPSAFRYVIELGDTSWHNDSVYALLRAHDIALCIDDMSSEPIPQHTTAELVYVRLGGNAASATGRYHPQTLRGWGVKANGWQRQAKQVILSFGGADPVAALKNAERFTRQVANG